MKLLLDLLFLSLTSTFLPLCAGGRLFLRRARVLRSLQRRFAWRRRGNAPPVMMCKGALAYSGADGRIYATTASDRQLIGTVKGFADDGLTIAEYGSAA